MLDPLQQVDLVLLLLFVDIDFISGLVPYEGYEFFSQGLTLHFELRDGLLCDSVLDELGQQDLFFDL